MKDKNLYYSITVALVFGILFAIAFNFFMREKIAADDGFSELYFTDHKNLPSIVDLNGTYDVSFKFTNYEGVNVTYFIEVGDSEPQSIVLEDGGVVEVDFKWVSEGEYNLFTVSTNYQVNTSQDIDFLDPLTVGLDGLGEGALNINISSTPLSFYSNSSSVVERGVDTSSGVEMALDMTVLTSTNKTLHLIDTRLFMSEHTVSVTTYNLKQPFAVKLYKGDVKDNPLQIHFWYLFK